MFSFRQFCFIVLTAIIFLTSCGGSHKDLSKVFRYNQGSDITSLDPAFARDQANIWALNQLYDGLVQFDSNLMVQPCIAKSWEISEDGLTYTFHLRNDVFFQDNELFAGGKGRLLKAADVAYSFNRLIDKRTASPGAWIFNGKIDTVQPFVAVNDTVFQMKLKKSFRPMLSLLAQQYCFIVPKEAVEKYGKEFRTHPVGTGPFKLKIWQEDNAMVLERNPHYWMKDGAQQLPYLDVVHISFVKSKQTEYLKFMKGDLDFMNYVDASTINELLTKDGQLQDKLKDKLTFFKRPYLNTEYLGMLMDADKLPADSPLRKKQVRQAINYAINREDMLRYLRNGIGHPANAGFVPFGLPSFDTTKVKGYTYDPDKARKLLTEAGYPNGNGMPEIKLYTNASYEDMANHIHKQLREVGINVILETVPPAFQRELMSKGQAQFFRASWIADYADAENYLSLFYSANGAPPNYTRFKNDKYDELYSKSLNENTDTIRFELYREMDRIIIDEAPVVPLFYDEVLRFVAKDVQGLQPNPMNLLDLRRVRKN